MLAGFMEQPFYPPLEICGNTSQVGFMLSKLHYCCVLLFCLVSSASGEDFVLRKAVECTPRGGLPNIRKKIEAGQTLKVAYLGGSITAAPGWRIKSREWLAAQYPKAKFEEIHAAIGGTGSDLGVFRLENDALRHSPDLLFVEFAVNDGGTNPSQIHKAMEGIVRQTWRSNPEIDICYVYTLTDKMLPDLKAGNMPKAASAMEVLADHYSIPSIHFGVKVAAMETAGELIFKAPQPKKTAETKPWVFSSDGVHPLVETGHQIYTDTIARSWPAIWEAGTTPGPHVMPDPVRKDNWEKARQIPITESMLKGSWTKLPDDDPLLQVFAKNMPQLFRADAPDAALVFAFDGTTAAVFDLLGPDGGQLTLQLDQDAPSTVNKIDAYCTYYRMAKTQIATDINPGTHQVTITLTNGKIDKRNILFEQNREFFDKNPEKFEKNLWYASSILVIGDVVK